MNDFYEGMPNEMALALKTALAEVNELKEHRRGLLEPYGVKSASELIEGIKSGAVPEHPAYDTYLALLSLEAGIGSYRERMERITRGEV